MRRAWRLAATILFTLIPAVRAADLSLPLNGFYHPGRYMPVRFSAAAGELRIAADGSVTTDIPSPATGIAPWLIVRSPLPSDPFSQPLHELRPTDKLVGSTLDATAISSRLFPHSSIVMIPLDPTHPLPGPPAAWQSLDALVCDQSVAVSMSDDEKRSLLAGGTTLAAAAPPDRSAAPAAPPDTHFPWQLDHGFWILRAPATFCAVPDDDAYQPIAGWSPGRSSPYRLTVLRLGLIFTIVFLGFSLLTCSWKAAPWVLSAAAIIAITCYDHHQTPLATALGVIRVAGTPSTLDTWLWQRAARDCNTAVPFSGLTLPILPAHGGPDGMTLFCEANGNPVEFRYHLAADRPAAFVFKSISLAPIPRSLTAAITSPSRFLPAFFYPGTIILGQGSAAGASPDDLLQWPPLLLANSDAIPRNVSGSSGRDSSNR